jgi:putative transposase
LHERITNKRNDFLHQLTAKLIKNHDSIAIEDLGVKNLLQNHKLAQAISDVSWSEFRKQLEYKSDWYGNNLLVNNRFEPTSKMCSECFQLNSELTLSDREWVCKSCGKIHDRDLNAAINIKWIALRNWSVNAPSGMERTVEPFEMSTLVESARKEAPISLE